MLFYRNRYYMPACNRFISEDPIGWASGQTNNYAYAYGNPVQFGDPYGLFGAVDLPSIPAPVNDFLVGMADSASFGLGALARNGLGIKGAVNPCSGAYTAGEVASLGLGLGRLGYASAAAGIRGVEGITGIAANLMRNDLKQVARVGLFPNTRMPSYLELIARGKTDAQIIDSASRTNATVNAVGANAALGAPVNAVVQASGGGCP